MDFEVSKVIRETVGNGVLCKLCYTPEFEEYCDFADGYYTELESMENGLLETIENIVREHKITFGITATAFVSDEDCYLYVKELDCTYSLCIMPVGINEKYRICAVGSIY